MPWGPEPIVGILPIPSEPKIIVDGPEEGGDFIPIEE